MSDVTFEDVARAAFWLQFNYDSECPYCNEKLARDRKYVLWHLKQEHPNIAYPEAAPEGGKDE